MSKLALNQNQFNQTPVLGQVVQQPSVDTESCQIDPNYNGSVIIQAGTAVKLLDSAGPQILVTPTTGPSDGPVYGVISYNLRGNTYNPGDMVEVAGSLNILFLKSGAAISRGARVAVTNSTSASNDPTVSTDTTAGDYTAGVAIGKATAGGQYIRVKIGTGQNITPSTTSTVSSVLSP